LNLDLVKDKRNARFEAVGGLLRPCSPLNKCLDKVIEPSPRAKSSHRFEWRLLELTTLHKTLGVITTTFNHYDSKVGIAAIGGVVEQLSSYRHFPIAQHYRACTHCHTQLGMLQYWQAESHRDGWNRVHLAVTIIKSDNLARVCMHCSVQHDPEKKKKEENIRLLIQSGRCHRCHVSKGGRTAGMGETSQVDWKRND
jgi:hypothetical protein